MDYETILQCIKDHWFDYEVGKIGIPKNESDCSHWKNEVLKCRNEATEKKAAIPESVLFADRHLKNNQ